MTVESKGKISRRKFVAGVAAGVVVAGVAGAAVGSLGFPKTSTTTETATQTTTLPAVTSTATQTTTLPAVTSTATTTTTLPAVTSTVTSTTTVAPPGPALTTFTVNGQSYSLQLNPNETLQYALQYQLGLTGAKTMCDRGECGSCTVIINGEDVLSCTVLAVGCAGATIETVEGIAADPTWAPLIQAYTENDCMQCGYCTPGFVVTAKNFLANNPNPTQAQILQALSGNICRCGTYPRHPIAITQAAAVMKGSPALRRR